MHTLAEFIARHDRLFILTGAGCSTDSGIPDYRDAEGDWKRTPPVTLQAFVSDEATRRRYWARSMLGWNRFGRAQPNKVHHALVQLERRGQQQVLLTQNVDRLHQLSGSRNVIDLHGRMDVVRCMDCEARSEREWLQQELLARNPDWGSVESRPAPDGDADLDLADFSGFDVPGCTHCGGMLKPDVVFFGENVPRERVETAVAHLEQADAMLVVGSSLMVYSGFRFARMAAAQGKPIAAVNLGRTRADELLSLKVVQGCAAALAFLLEGSVSSGNAMACRATG
ncbi:NAD-dependent protein deacetylase [Dokdonella sp.]|uniref:NAD-dependent protein deacetylase n=1 Tax=Dokdonella sp. TaxID=2291710 RepID=UPI003C679E30